MADKIPLFRIDWDREEILNVVDSVSRGGYWAKGPFVTEFEERLESFFNVDHAITFNSGTTALVGGLIASGVGPGDEVIVPSFTFVATANAVKLAGAEPVFADIEMDTYGLDPNTVRGKITNDTVALLPIHPYGLPCKIDQLKTIADDNDILLFEDAAEAFGAEYHGEKVGTFGDLAALSFCQNKVITTGEGGAILTDDDKIAQETRLYKSHGRATDEYFESTGSGQYVSLGTNNRMPDVVASIGVAQLTRSSEIIERRRQVAKQLSERFDKIPGVTVHREPSESKHVYQLYSILLESTATRDAVIDSLDAAGVSSKVYWEPPVHRTEFYKNETSATDLPVTDDVASRILSLPIYTSLEDDQIDRIVDGVAKGTEGER